MQGNAIPHNPEVVGSSPASATRKDTRLDTISSLVFLFYVGMMPGMGCCSNFFRYIGFCGSMVQCWICDYGRNRKGYRSTNSNRSDNQYH